MREHDYIDLTRDAGGHRAGERATIVGLRDTWALLEFADENGRTLDLPGVPKDALRVVETASGRGAPTHVR